ncbi:hypothetical protein V6L77_26040 [Pannonibacter sp. Pt2-lr]
MSGPWNDFNSAQSNTTVIPKARSPRCGPHCARRLRRPLAGLDRRLGAPRHHRRRLS